MTSALFLGALQGALEWLPVSSQGILTAVYSFMFDRPLSEGVGYALWLHMGTVFSALIALRKDVLALGRQVLAQPTRPSPMFRFLLVATLISGAIGFFFLLALQELSEQVGAAAMVLVGVLMLVTAGLQLRQGKPGVRTRQEISTFDALLAGVAQGFAALPGLSRSGLTVAALLARGVDRREALVLSFLMSIPASLGAALYVMVGGGLVMSTEMVVAAVAAFVVGLATINLLLAVARRVNFAAFVFVVALIIIAGAGWQITQG